MHTDASPRGHQNEVDELRERLREAEENLQAIRRGEVDAIVVSTPEGVHVYTLETGDLPYRTMVEDLAESAVTVASDYTIIYCNGSFAPLVGAPLESIIGTSILDYCSKRSLEPFTELLRAAMSGRRGSGEYYIRSKNGVEVPVYVSTSEMTRKGPAVAYAIFSNLTEREALLKRAINAERLANVGRFTQVIAHDLKGPLNIISQAAEMTQLHPEREQSMVKMIMENSERALNMIEEMRANTADITLFREYTDLSELVNNAIGRTPIPTQINVNLDLRPEVRVIIDRDKISRTIINIIQNAVEAMPEGGELGVAMEETGKYVTLKISDTGQGIPEGVSGRIFEPFTSSKPQGLGLSLAYGKRVVDSHGGFITFTTTAGKGTTFVLTLPIEPI